MRIRLATLAAAGLAALALAVPASATHTGCPAASDPNEPGHSEFASTHIVPLASSGDLGQPGEHRPGTHHGMSGCHPEESPP